MNKEIIKRRTRAIRKTLKQNQINPLIVTKPVNVTYATGFLGDDSWALIGQRSVYLLTDSRYTEQAQGECVNCKIIERTKSLPEEAAKLINKLNSIQTIGIEDSASIAVLKHLKKKINTKVKPTNNLIEKIRSVKDAVEITALKKSIQIAKNSLKKIRRFIKPGITEHELAGRLDFAIRKAGAINSFDTMVAFGPNGSKPHHKTGNRRLKKNDMVLIDFGVKYKGYCCDLTRCFTVGKSNAFYKKVYKAVQQAQAAAIKVVKAGVKIEKVDSAAREVIRKYDLPVYGHGTGHGLGLEVHELPIVAKKIKGKLQAGEVITIEPGVYIPGKLGIRIEDDILVTKTGCKILSKD